MGRWPEVKKDLIPVITSAPTTVQAALKNPEVRPSGPGDLFGLSLNRVFLIFFLGRMHHHLFPELLRASISREALVPGD